MSVSMYCFVFIKELCFVNIIICIDKFYVMIGRRWREILYDIKWKINIYIYLLF